MSAITSSGLVHPPAGRAKWAVHVNTTAGNETLPAKVLQNTIYIKTSNAAPNTLTLPGVATILALFPDLEIGDALSFRIAAVTNTLALASSGDGTVTAHASATVAISAGANREFILRVNARSGAAAMTVY